MNDANPRGELPDKPMYSTAPLFNDDPCVKCGTLGPALRFVAGGVFWQHYSAVDHLDATCWRCGYQWVMQPRDAKIANGAVGE